MEFLKLMYRMEQSTICQVVMATHSPMLMAYPGAQLLRLSKYGLEPVSVEATDHYRIMREFCDDPVGFVEGVLAGSRAVRCLGEDPASRAIVTCAREC
jgi:predicted ATPase